MYKMFFRILISAILAAGLLVTVASAQMSPWAATGGYSAYPGMAPPHPPVKCQPPAPPPCFPNPNPGCAPFPCYNPYACPPQPCMPAPFMEPSVYVGYLYKDHGAGVNIQFNNGDVVGITSTRNDFTLQGVWLELAAPFALSQNAGLFLSLAHLFPVQSNALESYQQLGGAAKREWSPDIQWWELDSALTYRLSQGVFGLAGFRWSSFVVDFGQATNQQNFSTSPDQAQLSVNAYIPYLGLELQADPNCNSSFKAAFLGFPALPSDAEFQETFTPTGEVYTRFSGKTDYKSGYFLEGLAEASMRMAACSLGAFVRFDAIHTDRTRNFIGPDGSGRSADIQFDRRNWIFGGKIGFVF
ncbi:MAG: hypothetical protein ACLP5H_07330 [Desulfomonilaceae bacterium]